MKKADFLSVEKYYIKGIPPPMQIQGDMFVNKLILLFVFDKMESALSERTIIDMCSTSNDWINYMDCMIIISQLL